MVKNNDPPKRAQAKAFLRQKDTLLKNIQDALKNNNKEAICKNVNILKNAGALFDSERIVLIARHIESLSEHNSFTGIDEAMIELASVANALGDELEKIFPDLTHK